MLKIKTSKNLNWVQVLWSLAGIILLLSAFYVYNVPDNKLIYIADRLGYAMLFVGFINLFIYSKKRSKLHCADWLLADGMSTALLSIFPLFNQMILPVIIPFFFGIWELFLGILKIIEATELSEDSIKGWHWFFAIGVFELISGVTSLLKPVEDYVGMNHVISAIFLVQGIGYIFKIIIFHRLEKNKIKS